MNSFDFGPARVCWTDSRDGNFAGYPPEPTVLKAALENLDAIRCEGSSHRAAASKYKVVSWLVQVHGTAVVAEAGIGAEADAIISRDANYALCIRTADCAPIALASGSMVAAVHAGWSGLHAGVIESCATAMRNAGESEIRAAIGPCIHGECYEFGDADQMNMFENRWGSSVRTTTPLGMPAFDMLAAIRAELDHCDIELVKVVDECTHCTHKEQAGYKYYSHRRGDEQRQAMFVEYAG